MDYHNRDCCNSVLLQALYLQYVLQYKAIPLSILDAPKGPITGINWTRRAQLKNVLTTHSYRSADCDTDYSLVHSKVLLIPKKIHHSRSSGPQRINTARFKIKVSDADLCCFCQKAQETLMHLFWDCPVTNAFWKNVQYFLFSVNLIQASGVFKKT